MCPLCVFECVHPSSLLLSSPLPSSPPPMEANPHMATSITAITHLGGICHGTILTGLEQIGTSLEAARGEWCTEQVPCSSWWLIKVDQSDEASVLIRACASEYRQCSLV